MKRKKLPPQFSRTKGLLVFTPNSDNIKEAFERSEELGVLPNSFTRGAGRMTGFLGEVAFENLYPEALYVGDKIYTHDYELGKRRIDVKAKCCSGKPQPHYTASVNCPEGKKLPANAYYFVRVKKDFTRAWMLGWATGLKIQKSGLYKKKGEPDDYGFTYKVDVYHLPIEGLRPANSL